MHQNIFLIEFQVKSPFDTLYTGSDEQQLFRDVLSSKSNDLLESLGPGFLSASESRLKVLRLPEAAEHLLMEGLLLPRPDPVPVLRHQGAADGGVQGGETVGGGEETLPRP